MRKIPVLTGYMSQLLVLALLGYGLDLSCLLTLNRCVQQSECCVSCNLPAQFNKTDNSVHINLWPAFLPTGTLFLAASDTLLDEIELSFELDVPPRILGIDQTDPVRGPPFSLARL